MDYSGRFRARQRRILCLGIGILCVCAAYPGAWESRFASPDQLRSFTLTMKGSWFGSDVSSRYLYKSPDCFRMDVGMEDGNVTAVCVGSDCWTVTDGTVGELDELGRNQILQGFADLTGDIGAIRTYYGAQIVESGESMLEGVAVVVYCISGMSRLDPEIMDLVRGALYVEKSTGMPKRLEFDYTALDGTRQVFNYGVVDGCAIARSMQLFAGEEPKLLITVEETIVNGPIDMALFARP
jgi:hypothetical protein